MFIVIEFGVPGVVAELEPFRPNRLAAMRATWMHCQAFDATTRYEARPERMPRVNIIQRFLARIIYAPVGDTEVRWCATGTYALQEIVAEVEEGLKKDDDIIQQWFDAGDVMHILRSARTFDEMVDRVRCICGEFQDDPRLEKIVEDILGPGRGVGRR